MTGEPIVDFMVGYVVGTACTCSLVYLVAWLVGALEPRG